MSKKQTKTNHSQQDNRSVKSGLLQPADIHNKTREQKLKESINKFQLSILNDIAKCSYLDGRKEGIKEERERIMKIIDDRMEHYDLKLDTKAQVALESVKQKIKGD